MVFVVEMCHGVPDTADFRFFSCHAEVWGEALKLAQYYGWMPAGTVPTKESLPDWEKLGQFKPSYEPDDVQYDKQVLWKDARNLANALVRVRDNLHKGKIKCSESGRTVLIREGMSAVEYQQANEGLTETFLTQFIEFLKRGPFIFFWDD